jgi:phosphoesterase RecJ-like protein
MQTNFSTHPLVKTSDIEAFQNILDKAHSIVVTSHRSPDGDAVGCALAMTSYLRTQGKSVTTILPDPPDEALMWMPGVEDIVYYAEDSRQADELMANADVLFALDYNRFERLGRMSHAARKSPGKWLLVDHHELPDNFQVAQVHAPACSSTAELLYAVIVGLGGADAVDNDMAALLYTGIMTDTGSFRFPGVTPTTHLIVADMIASGLEHAKVHEHIHGEAPLDRLRLNAFALNERLEVFPEFHTALIHLTAADMGRFDYRPGYTEGLVNQALGIQGIRFAVFAKEGGERVKMSFRSIGSFSARAFAEDHFDGGGHHNAAGGASSESIDVVMAKLRGLLPQIQTQLLAAQ